MPSKLINLPKTIKPQHIKFVKNLASGMTQREAAIKAGYSATNTNTLMRRLRSNEAIVKLMNDNGLTDLALIQGIKTNIESGIGIKSTADSATKNIELALKLKGYLNKDDSDSDKDINISIELRNSSKEELLNRLNSIDGEIVSIKDSI